MAINPQTSKDILVKNIETGYDILHIGLSSALSSNFSNSALAAKELEEEYPNCRILVIHSLCASMGKPACT